MGQVTPDTQILIDFKERYKNKKNVNMHLKLTLNYQVLLVLLLLQSILSFEEINQ